MPNTPERLDIQLRRARMRRDAVTIGGSTGVISAILALAYRWLTNGWHWWYVPVLLVALVVCLWLARLDADVTERATRWFWRSPR